MTSWRCVTCDKTYDYDPGSQCPFCSSNIYQEEAQQNQLREIAKALDISVPIVGYINFSTLMKKVREKQTEFVQNENKIYELQQQPRQEREKNQELTRQLQTQQNQQFEAHTNFPPRGGII